MTSTVRTRGRDSSVGIATLYGLDGPGIESRWGMRFSAPIQTGPGAHPASYTIGARSFPGIKRPRRDDHQPSYSAEVKEIVELLYAFFWVIPRLLNFICRRFGTHSSIFIGGECRMSFYTYLPMKMEQTVCSETSENKIQTPGNYPEESIQQFYYFFNLGAI